VLLSDDPSIGTSAGSLVGSLLATLVDLFCLEYVFLFGSAYLLVYADSLWPSVHTIQYQFPSYSQQLEGTSFIY